MERRLTTIFAADVVGYSQLMARDEESTLARLRDTRQVIDGQIDKHGGRIFNTAGDSVLAEFDSAVECVRCAIAVQEDLRVRNHLVSEDQQIWLRIGVNVGDVMIEDGDLFGDGVNVAARLEGLAEKGGVCVSSSVYDLVKNKVSIKFQDTGSHTVKNIPDPISVFKIVPSEAAVETPGASDSKMLILPAAVVIVLVLGVFGAWYNGVLSSNPYDGTWRVTYLTSSGCPSLDHRVPLSYVVKVTNGNIDEQSYPRPKVGKIETDGTFRITSLNRSGGAILDIQEGKITGTEGEGTFRGANVAECKGDLKVVRIE